MPNVLIRDLPDEVHRELVDRAGALGLSLQQYLTRELTRVANSSSLDEVLDRIEQRSGGSVGLHAAAEHLRRERERG